MIRMSTREAARYGLHMRGVRKPSDSVQDERSAPQTTNCPPIDFKSPLTLILSFPPTVNTYWRRVGDKTLISKKGRMYRLDVEACVTAQYGHFDPIDKPVKVTIRFVMPDHRKRDLDNLPKGLLDALTKAGVWHDDSQVHELILQRAGVGRGLAEVTIEALDMPTEKG